MILTFIGVQTKLGMFFRIIKIALLITISVGVCLAGLFFVCPAFLVDVYRGADERTVWIKTKHLPIKKLTSDTDSYKFSDIQWSPNKRMFAFYDFVRLEWATKEWALKIVDARTLKTKTIFIGDYKTGQYKWIDNESVRVYEGAGSGVRIYRDIDINVSEPVIAADHLSPEYWTPETSV